MNYREIIRDSWALTRENKRFIWWFAFIPALFATVFAIGYMCYQAAAFYVSPFFNDTAIHAKSVPTLIIEEAIKIFSFNTGIGVFLTVLAGICALIYLLLPVFTQGALIQLVAHVRIGENVSVLRGLSFGLSRFLQLFEYSMLVRTFSFFGILTEVSFAARNLGPETLTIFGWVFGLFLIISLLLTLLFTYSEYYIVIDKSGVFESMLASGGLVIRQLHHTIFMFILMVIISFRIIINIVVALLIPLLVIGPIFLFASITMTAVGVVIGSIIGLIALYFASYFLGVFHVFATAVWTFTFLELTTEEESIDLRAKAVKKEENEVENAEDNNPVQHA